MKEGVIPDRFFEYRYDVKCFVNSWHQNKSTKAKKAIFKKLSNDAMNNILSMKAIDIFEKKGISGQLSWLELSQAHLLNDTKDTART